LHCLIFAIFAIIVSCIVHHRMNLDCEYFVLFGNYCCVMRLCCCILRVSALTSSHFCSLKILAKPVYFLLDKCIICTYQTPSSEQIIGEWLSVDRYYSGQFYCSQFLFVWVVSVTGCHISLTGWSFRLKERFF